MPSIWPSMDTGNRKKLGLSSISSEPVGMTCLQSGKQVTWTIVSLNTTHYAITHITDNLHTGNWAQHEQSPFPPENVCYTQKLGLYIFFYSISHSLPPTDKRWKYGITITLTYCSSVFRCKISAFHPLTQLTWALSYGIKRKHDWPT